MASIYWIVAGFFSGSIPYSVILARFSRHVDVRDFGDHNPGAWNVIAAAGWRWGLAAMLLDGFKGAIPVGLAWYWAGINDWHSIPIALSPVIGHIYSPWLKFQGGKAVATSFGIWAGLTLGIGPTLLGLLLALFYSIMDSSEWSVIFTMICFGIFITFWYAPVYPQFTWIWLGNIALLLWTHRYGLSERPSIRQSIWDKIRRKR